MLGGCLCRKVTLFIIYYIGYIVSQAFLASYTYPVSGRLLVIGRIYYTHYTGYTFWLNSIKIRFTALIYTQTIVRYICVIL